MTGKQRAKLRAMANTIEPIFQIGKAGVTDNLIAMLDEALEARELIKGTILETAGLSARETVDQLAEALHAQPIQAIGRKIVLYRESREKKRIEL